MKRKRKTRKIRNYAFFRWGGEIYYGEITGGSAKEGYEIRKTRERLTLLVSAEKIIRTFNT